MHDEGSRLAAYARAVRESTLKRLRLVPAGRENWHPTEQALSFADIAQHLVAADEWLLAKLADPRLAGMRAYPGMGRVDGYTAFLAMVERLRALGEERREVISRLSNAALDGLVTDDRFGGEVSVWWVIVRGTLEHEAQHRGQLASYLRIVGAFVSGDRGPVPESG